MGEISKRKALSLAADKVLAQIRAETAPPKDNKFLTSKEVADRWRLSDQTLANWRYAGKGPPFIRVGSRVLYPVEGIHSFEKLDPSWLSSDNSQATSAETQS
jgi:hypothetical protein